MGRLQTPAGRRPETLELPGASPSGFHQLLNDPAAMPSTTLWAHLLRPDGSGPWPLVLVVPGSVGIAPAHLAKADLLVDAGIAAAVLDPFGPRGVSSTVADQAQFTFAASSWDVLAALPVLAAQEGIDSERLGAQGHSRGGTAVLSAAVLAQRSGLYDGPALGAVYAAYPWCGLQFERPAVGSTRVRAIIGADDDWCLPQQVQGYLQAMRLLGGDATWRIVEAAQHSFDRSEPVATVPEASVAPTAPTVYIRADGALRHPLAAGADPALGEREVMRWNVTSGRGQRGAHMGGSPTLARLFREDMLAFWGDALE